LSQTPGPSSSIFEQIFHGGPVYPSKHGNGRSLHAAISTRTPRRMMGNIDWSKLYEATNKDNRPTPGYLFNEIIQNVSYAVPQRIPEVATYLADCIDGDHAHVKLKALFVIKNLAFRVPPFCRCMQDRISSVQEAAVFTGPPSAIYGDEPYRLVRDAAESALAALTKGEHYHEEYREMSQRIVGFGNYLPGEDTLLADGSVNTMPDVGVKEIAMGTLGFLSSGVGSLVGGVTGMLTSPFSHENGGLEGLGGDDDFPDFDRGHDPDDPEDELHNDTQDADTDNEEDYRPSAGSYVPPTVPISAPAAQVIGQTVEQQEVDEIEDLFRPDADADVRAETVGTVEAPSSAREDASFFRLLGISTEGSGEPSAGGGPCLAKQEESQVETEADMQPSESEILEILGLSGGSLSSSAPVPMQDSAFMASEGSGLSTSALTIAMPSLVAADFKEQQPQQQQQQQHGSSTTPVENPTLAAWPSTVPYPAPESPLPKEPPPNQEEPRPAVVIRADGFMEI